MFNIVRNRTERWHKKSQTAKDVDIYINFSAIRKHNYTLWKPKVQRIVLVSNVNGDYLNDIVNWNIMIGQLVYTNYQQLIKSRYLSIKRLVKAKTQHNTQKLFFYKKI